MYRSLRITIIDIKGEDFPFDRKVGKHLEGKTFGKKVGKQCLEDEMPQSCFKCTFHCLQYVWFSVLQGSWRS